MRRLAITLAALSIAGISLALWVRWERGLDPVERGKHLVRVVGCNDCHTPTIKGPGGLPIPDTSRLLSGHPEGAPYPTWTPSDLRERNIGAAAGPLRTVWAGPWGVAFTANLTPDTETGIGNWTEEMFIQAIRTGKHQGQDTGRAILPPMPLANLNHPAYGIRDDDLKDIWAYLRSLPPVRNRVPPPIPPRPGT
jgi:hypothetical protein